MVWFELNESAEFGENEVAKRGSSNSESESEELQDFVQGSEVSTFDTKK